QAPHAARRALVHCSICTSRERDSRAPAHLARTMGLRLHGAHIQGGVSMADEPSTGVAEMKAVLLDLLHPGKPAHGDASDQGNQPMAGRDTHDSEHAHVPGRAGGRQDEKLNTTDDRPEEYGAGANQAAPAKDADSGNWPPKDWDENGNARRHGQSREGKGPGGYEDRSRELRD